MATPGSGPLHAGPAWAGRVREFVAAEAAGERLDGRVAPLLERAVLFGEVPRGDVVRLVSTAERQGRRLLALLVERGLLTGRKDAPLRIAFPLGETERWFPHLWAPSALGTLVDHLRISGVGSSRRPPNSVATGS